MTRISSLFLLFVILVHMKIEPSTDTQHTKRSNNTIGTFSDLHNLIAHTIKHRHGLGSSGNYAVLKKKAFHRRTRN